MRLVKKYGLLDLVYVNGVYYPAPSNFSYMWNFGIYALVCLAVQLITGIFLAMHYAPEQTLAFFSVEHIMRDVNYGWLLRYIHANGASMFFIVVYVHTFRGLYYGSYHYPRENLWIVGVIIILIMILTAFLGYVLPWGQMSFWAAIVITSLLGSIPILGNEILIVLWGGYSIYDLTLRRFYSFHFLFPFVILFIVLLHVFFLHEFGSSNPLGMMSKVDSIPLLPYYGLKDFSFIIFIWLIFFFLIFYIPDLIVHSDNFIESDTFVTPEHIVPEWYFLSLYAILRSVVDKLLGLILGILSILG